MAHIRGKVLINCDLGEAYGNYACGPDEELLPLIDLANVACGFHAGDPVVMARTVKLCKAHGVGVGAHPGLPDVQGFGRREMKLTSEEHTANVAYQVGALQAFLEREGMALHHVKPHGMLYGLMARDKEVARAVWAGVPRGTRVLGLAGTAMEEAAGEAGLEFVAEYFADVAYRGDGSLVVERKKAAWAAAAVRAHVRQQLEHGSVTAADTGATVALARGGAGLEASVCCHSDAPGCVETVRATREVVDGFNAGRGV